MTSTRPAWTLTEAVERTGASRSTLRRYREAGKLPNAYKDTAGSWRFPLEDLLAAGLKLVDPAHVEQVTTPNGHPHPLPEQATPELQLKVMELEKALAVERARNEGLERIAASAQANADDLRRALRMLEVSRPEPAQAEQVSMVNEHPAVSFGEQPEPPLEHAPKRAWWRFR
jgi:aspartate aminotransferase-like enzyme